MSGACVGPIDDDGAVVRVQIAATDIESESLARRGLAVLTPLATTALIDAGASQSAIAPFVAEYLQLVPSGTRRVIVPGDAGVITERIYPTYDMALFFGMADWSSRFSRDIVAVAATPATPSVSMLIGRDILSRCFFVFNGRKGRFSLAYPTRRKRPSG